MIQPSVSNSVVINLELVDAPNVRNLEDSLVHAIGFLLQCGADEGVDAHKLQLHVCRVERLPFAILQLFNFDSVYLVFFFMVNKFL